MFQIMNVHIGVSMENRNRWLVELNDNKDLWASETDSIPAMIKYSYTQLRNLVADGQVYGAMMQFKDLYESLHKIPVIMSLIIIDSDEKYKEGDAYADILKALLESPLSMGQWDTVAATIIKKNKNLQLPVDLIEILSRTRILYRTEVTQDVPDVINWRNEAIGHGALKFEDDESYKSEVKSLVSLLKVYFDGGAKYSIKGLYDKIFFVLDDQKLIGDNNGIPRDDTNLYLSIDSKTYDAGYFVNNHDLRYYLFDSYFSKKNLIKYNSYYGGQSELLKSKYFSDLFEKHVMKPDKNFDIQSDYISREEDMILEYLNMPISYIKPTGMIEKLADAMEKIEHGVIAVFMERGTGKSAFANQMSGLYHRVPLFKKSLSRCYHVQNAALRGLNDFFNSVNFSFRHSNDSRLDLWGSAEEIPVLTNNTEKPAKDMAVFLNFYHKKYKKDTTILVIDGIDELTEQTRRILEFIPSREELDEGVFVILLSRLKDEDTVIGSSVRYIEAADKLSQTRLCIKRTDDENLSVLRECIQQEIKEGHLLKETEIDGLIARADCRFLYLKGYIGLTGEDVLDNNSEYDFIKSYMNYILSFYGPTQKHKLLIIAETIALFPSISVRKYKEYLDCSNLTYDFVGLLNDLLPVMTVLHIDGEDIFSFADIAYSEYLIKEYPEIVREVIKGFYVSLVNSLETYMDTGGSFRRIDDFSNKTEEALNKAIIFFTEGLLGLWNRLGDNKAIRDGFFDKIYPVRVAASLSADKWSKVGYGLYLKTAMMECMDSVFYYCIKNYDDEKIRKWHKEVISQYNSIEKGYYNPLKMVLHNLRLAKNHPDIYDYVDSSKDFNIEAWFEFIVNKPSDANLNLIIKQDAFKSFIGYLQNNGTDYDLSKWSGKISNADLSMIGGDSAISKAKWIVTEFQSKEAVLTDKRKDNHELFSATYKRLCYERDNGSLYEYIESEYFIHRNFVNILKDEFGNGDRYYKTLKTWIDEIGRYLNENSYEGFILLSVLMVEEINWLKEHSREDDALTKFEDFIYNTDTKAFFVSRDTELLPFGSRNKAIFGEKPLVYCTDNVIYLLEYYNEKGDTEKFHKLMEKIEHDISVIDVDHVDSSVGMAFCEIHKSRFAGYRKEKGYSSEFDSYFKEMLQHHYDSINAILKDLSRNSNFTELSYHVELLLEYAWQSGQWDEGIEKSNSLLKTFSELNDCLDTIVRQSVDSQCEIIEVCKLYFKLLKGEEVVYVKRKDFPISSYQFLNEKLLFDTVNLFTRSRDRKDRQENEKKYVLKDYGY